MEVVGWNPRRNTLRRESITCCASFGMSLRLLRPQFLICEVKGQAKSPCIVYEFSQSSELLWSSHLGLALFSAS